MKRNRKLILKCQYCEKELAYYIYHFEEKGYALFCDKCAKQLLEKEYSKLKGGLENDKRKEAINTDTKS